MRTVKTTLLSLGLAAALSSPASAQTLGFDDVAGPFQMLNSYSGYTWTNAFVIDPTWYFGSAAAAGGFATGVVSPTMVAANAGGNAMGIGGANPFTLNGGVFTAAWRTGLTLTARGFLGGNEIYNKVYSLNATASQYLALDMYGVDNVVFETSGGVNDVYARGNRSFIVDNLTFNEVNEKLVGVVVTPEPASMVLMAFGLGVVGFATQRRRKATRAN